MDSSKYNFVTVNEILADVIKLTNDERYETNNKGYYTSQIQQALEGLAFDTFFDTQRKSFDFPVDTLSLEMPVGAFNIKNVYLFEGTECDIAKSQKVWWKKDYYTRGRGYIADNKGNNNNDPFFPSSISSRMLPGANNIVRRESPVEQHYFYNIQNGIIMFSSLCRNFPKVHIVYNGTGCEIGDIPIIPLFLREAVIDFVTEVTLRVKMAVNPRENMTLWQIYDKRLNRDQQYGFGTGSWVRAENRIKTMSSGERSDLFEYFGRSEWANGL